ncbi:MAG: peroxiredoxin [Alphaproteobacteria bacterium]
MSEITVGKKAPDFELRTDGDGVFRLSERTEKTTVLYFYPKDDTPGCTAESIAFTGLADQFAAADALVVGISPDSPKSHDRFKAKYELSVVLAADTEKEVSDLYGVWVQKSRYGREYMGIERSTFLIGRDGTVTRVWRKVKVNGHAEEVLQAVVELG